MVRENDDLLSLDSLSRHVLEEKVGYHGDGDDFVGLIDDLGDQLVLDAHHILAVHLFVKKEERKQYDQAARSTKKSDLWFREPYRTHKS